MARSLEGRKFFVNHNNGVSAIVAEEVHGNMELRWRVETQIRDNIRMGVRSENYPEYLNAMHQGLTHIVVTPVFTFVDADRKSHSPWFTGSTLLQHALLRWIKENGGEIQTGIGWVPFSNGVECAPHNPEAFRRELQYVTTEMQFVETFGATPREIEKWHYDHTNKDGFHM